MLNRNKPTRRMSDVERGKEGRNARERNVPVKREGHGVHKLRRVGDEREDGDPEELFVDARSLEDDIDHVDEDLYEMRRDEMVSAAPRGL